MPHTSPSGTPDRPSGRRGRHRARRTVLARPAVRTLVRPRALVPATATVLLVATTAAGSVDPAAAGASGPTERVAQVDGTLAGADISLAAVESEVVPTRAELRGDRTRPGRAQLTALGVSRLVEPADVVAGRTLEERPPPWQLPVQGARLTAGFGDTGLWASTHTGLDFAAPEDTPLVAIGPATVESAAYDGAYGNKVVLRLEDGTVLWYAHLSSVAVAPGQQVEAGQQVGTLGSTGNSTGPHLHLEVRPADGEPIDPAGWLAERGLL